ncbi:hypothetical protein L7F22_063723 [Adiantum nelumboides]|nr:hypothetical protein [Adiantum nelumboides]
MASNREEKRDGIRIPACSQKSALLVVSMQNDFLAPSSRQYTAVSIRRQLLPLYLSSTRRFLSRVREELSLSGSFLVVWPDAMYQWSCCTRTSPEWDRSRVVPEVTFAGIVVKGTKGAAVIDELKPQPEDYVIAKTRFSAFFGTNLHLVLQSAGIQNLIFTGIQTPNCIRQAVFDAVALDYPSVVVLSDATAAYKPKVHEANLYDMRMVKVATPTVAEWMEVEHNE